MTAASPSFLVADACDVFRKGLISLLTTRFTGCTVTCVTEAHSLLHAAAEQYFDVLLIAGSLPPLNGFEAARNLLQQNSDCSMMLYGYAHDEKVLMEAFASGAGAWFYHDDTEDAIVFKVSEMLRCGYCITPDAVKAYKAAHRRLHAQQQNATALTVREKEVLQLIIKGFKNKEIAEALYLSVKTIENHRSHIMVKANQHNTAQLLAHAKETGWL